MMNKIEETDRAWLRIAMVFGMSMSRDPERKIGACIIGDNGRSASFGYNGFARRVTDTVDNWADKDFKNEMVIHAEENALINTSFDVSGGTCYIPLKPCHRCLSRLVNAHILRVVWLSGHTPWKYERSGLFNFITECNPQIQLVEYSPTALDNDLKAAFKFDEHYSIHGQQL